MHLLILCKLCLLLYGNKFISLDIHATLFVWSLCHCNKIFFIVTNWMSYSLWLTPIPIISLLWYWYIVANFCNISGTHCVQTCLFETWGDIVKQYIAVVVHHYSFIQETDEKVVLCNARSVSEIVNIWWWEEQLYTFTFIWECLTEISWLFINIHLGTCHL